MDEFDARLRAWELMCGGHDTLQEGIIVPWSFERQLEHANRLANFIIHGISVDETDA